MRAYTPSAIKTVPTDKLGRKNGRQHHSKPIGLNLRYRAEIDGLRAVAVVTVLIFHFFPEILPLGYLGVDIFFVISGFLITGLMLRELNGNNFSFKRFYLRRIRRILPATLVVSMVSAVGALILLTPPDLVRYSYSLLSTTGFFANVYFWRSGGYFSSNDELKPLLHMWSLGVEEQFYLIFPGLLFLAFILVPKKRLLVGFAVLLMAISFFADVFLQYKGGANPAFFLLPTRAWQFGVGALAAIAYSETRQCLNREIIFGLVGLACLNFFTIIKGLPAGTMLSVACGMLLYRNLNSETQLVRFLTLSPVRKIGLISFSLYLWHWPIVSFLKYVYIDGVPIGMLVLGIVSTFVLSYLSWRFVEEPFRKQKSNAAVLKFVISTAVITLIFGTFTISRDGFKSRHSELVNALSSAIQTNYRCPVSTYFAYGASRACLAGSATQVDYDIALLGNSHAQMYGHAFIKSLKKVGKRGVIVPLNGCIPTLDLNISSDCIGPARKNFEAVRDDPKINKIVIGLNWRLETLVNSEGETVSDISKRKRADALLKLISLLKQSGKDVYLMGPIATPDFRMASDLSRRLVFSDGQPQSEILEMMRFSKGSFDSEFGEVIQFLQKELGDKFLMPHEMLCDLEYCYFATELNIYFADSEHLSRQGSLLMVPLFDKIIDGS